MRETEQKGADVVITACPVPSAQQQALELTANYGRICFSEVFLKEKTSGTKYKFNSL